MSLAEYKANLPPRKQEVVDVLGSYLDLESKFENPPIVSLELVSTPLNGEEIGARDIATTTAVQCYAPGTAKLKSRGDEKSQSIAESTLKGGHHTTRMHTYYTFHLTVTRDLTERTLHFTPFYNSEQQSQRYVEAKAGNYEIPAGLTPEQREKYVELAEYMNNAYFDLLVMLGPEVEKRMKQMYPEDGWNVAGTKARLDSKTQKICQEIARYVLPIAQKTTMYHSLSELQILRLFRASQFQNFTDEGRFVIAKMIEEIAKIDPTILQELDKPIVSNHGADHNIFSIVDQKTEFDNLLDQRQSLLLSGTKDPRKVLAIAVRNVLGKGDAEVLDENALSFLMDPKNNPLLADVYETGMFDPLTSALRQVSFTFATKLSHTAESQRQRQRRTPGATPPVDQQYDGTADYITPLVIRENPNLQKKYDGIMRNIYFGINSCLKAGIPKEIALKLLPNAHAIRTVETGDLFDWLHRFKQRLCYLAQEEICFISIEQALDVLKILPEAEKMLQAPCGVASVAETGRCPEGDRWCGKPVWKWRLNQYKEGRLV